MTVSQGRVGGAVALREARKLIYEQRAASVVIAGVDSYLSTLTLKGYENKVTDQRVAASVLGRALDPVLAAASSSRARVGRCRRCDDAGCE